MNRYRCISMVTLVVLFSAGVCLADDAESLDDLKKENADADFELSHWLTRYKHLSDGDSFRFQTSFIYKF